MMMYNDETIIALASLNDQMFKELRSEVEELGGTIDVFEPEDRLISVSADPELKEHIEDIIAQIVAKYEDKRKEIVDQDAFCGVRFILDELKEDTDN
jgi:hypothetical protein